MKIITILLLGAVLYRTNAAEIAFVSTSDRDKYHLSVNELCMIELDDSLNEKLLNDKLQLFDYSTLDVHILAVLKNGKEYKLFYLIKQKGKYGFSPCTFQFDGVNFSNIKTGLFEAIVIDELILGAPTPAVKGDKQDKK